MTTLPSEPGFYWWRPFDTLGFKLLRVRYCGLYLQCDDVSEGAFIGLRFDDWRMWRPIGEWVKIEEPK